MGKRLELTGQKFGILTVIGFSYVSKRKSYWLCKCECGNEKIIQGVNLTLEKTKSCGCSQSRTLSEGIAARNKVLGQHKRSATGKNLEQALTDEQILFLHKQNCHYCGVSPSNICSPKKFNGDYVYNGIDRMDNDVGYTVDNSITCCSNCNYAKRNRTYEEFKDWIKQVHLHLSL